MNIRDLRAAAIILLLLVTSSASASDGIVVWNIDTKRGVDPRDAESISGLIASEVGYYTDREVISEADVYTIIRGEEKKQKCGSNDSVCLTEISGALGVPEAISGDLGKVGDIWILNLRRLMVREARVIARSTRQVEGSISDLVREVPGAVAELFGKKVEPAVGLTPTGNPMQGALIVGTHPKGAEIFIDDKPAGKSPVTLALLEGQYKIVARLDKHKDGVSRVIVRPKKETEVSLRLAPYPGTINVKSQPDGAKVFINDREKGVTPLKLALAVIKGGYSVRVEKDGFESVSRKVDLKPKEDAILDFELKKLMGTLAVASTPEKAEISIDGEPGGASPVELKLPVGKYKVGARLEGYEVAEKLVSVKAKEKSEVNLALVKTFPMSPYKKWGYISFFSGVGLVGISGIFTWRAKESRDEFEYSGGSSDKTSAVGFMSSSLVGYTLGAAMMATGVALWILDPGDREWAEKQAVSIGPNPDGRGVALFLSGGW